jgi:hypothetical protein
MNLVQTCELFISLLKSPISSKSEFGPKSYAKNTNVCHAENRVTYSLMLISVMLTPLV